MSETWKKITLRDCGKWLSGGTPSKENTKYWNGEIPWISASTMHEISISDSPLKVSTHAIDNGTKVVPKGTILLLVRGSMLFKKIPVCITLKEVAFNQDVKAIIPNKNIDAYFLLSSILAKENDLLSLVEPTGIGAGKLSTDVLDRFYIPLPPLDEQRKIAEILSTWDEAIQTTEKLIAALEKRKKGFMQRLLTGQVRFPGFTDEWKEVKLGDLISINYGKSPKEIKDEKGKYSIIGTGGEVGKTNSPLCEKPVIVIGRKGSIDKPKLIEEPNWVIDTAYYCIPQDGIDIYWLYYYLFYKGFAKFNEGSTLPSLSRPTVESIKIIIPEFSEQQKISTCFSEIDKQINIYERKKQVLQKQKQGLMQRLLTGQVRVSI